MSQSKQPLNWLKQLVPGALRSAIKGASPELAVSSTEPPEIGRAHV